MTGPRTIAVVAIAVVGVAVGVAWLAIASLAAIGAVHLRILVEEFRR
jgi:hypothetical protein